MGERDGPGVKQKEDIRERCTPLLSLSVILLKKMDIRY